MPEVILPGASGRIEGRYSPGKRPNAPIALILHPHPKANGHMNNPVALGCGCRIRAMGAFGRLPGE